jgi:hypothetical protein
VRQRGEEATDVAIRVPPSPPISVHQRLGSSTVRVAGDTDDRRGGKMSERDEMGTVGPTPYPAERGEGILGMILKYIACRVGRVHGRRRKGKDTRDGEL